MKKIYKVAQCEIITLSGDVIATSITTKNGAGFGPDATDDDLELGAGAPTRFR